MEELPVATEQDPPHLRWRRPFFDDHPTSFYDFWAPLMKPPAILNIEGDLRWKAWRDSSMKSTDTAPDVWEINFDGTVDDVVEPMQQRENLHELEVGDILSRHRYRAMKNINDIPGDVIGFSKHIASLGGVFEPVDRHRHDRNSWIISENDVYGEDSLLSKHVKKHRANPWKNDVCDDDASRSRMLHAWGSHYLPSLAQAHLRQNSHYPINPCIRPHRNILPDLRFKRTLLPSLLLVSLLVPGAAAIGTRHVEAGSGVTAGLLSIWKANITPSKDENIQLFYHAIQATTILALIIYASYGTMRRSDKIRQLFVLVSLMCGVGLAAWYPGRRFETCLEGFVALGFFAMGFVFDNASSWWDTFWDLLERLRPRTRTRLPEPPV